MARSLVPQFRFPAQPPAEAGGGWLAPLRRAALDRFRELALPSVGVEEWKYTNLRELADTAFELAATDAVVSDELARRIRAAAPDGHRLVFVNGAFRPELSEVGALPPGARVASLGEALRTDADGLRPHLERLSGLDGAALLALNTAFMRDGLALVLDAGVTLDRPVALVFAGVAGVTPTACHPRNLIVLGDGARATIIETHLGAGSGRTWSNPVTETVLGRDADLEHVKIDDEGPDAFHLAQHHLELGAGACYRGFVLNAAGRLVRDDVAVRIAGAGADCRLDAAILGAGDRHADVTTRIDHAVPHGSSRQVCKTVLTDAAQGVFQGKIVVVPHAQKTDAFQTSRTLLLSDRALMNAKPELEIFADDVKCSHGATTGTLDPDELFYLRARGVGAEEAQRLLIRGFLADLGEGLRATAARRPITAAVEDWLRTTLGLPAEADASAEVRS